MGEIRDTSADACEALDYVLNKFNSGLRRSISYTDIILDIQGIMWRNANVIRNEDDLNKALEKIDNIRNSYNAVLFFSDPKDIKLAVKAQYFIELSTILLNAMKLRKESRGPHYMEDYTEINETDLRKRIFINRLNCGNINYRLG